MEKKKKNNLILNNEHRNNQLMWEMTKMFGMSNQYLFRFEQRKTRPTQ